MRSFFGKVRTRLYLPLLFLISEEKARKLGLFTLGDERFEPVYPELEGKVLDLGCRLNDMIKEWRKMGGVGIGADIFPLSGCDVILEDKNKLPFEDAEFNTVTLVATLNHISNRKKVLREVNRVLVNDGKLVITVGTPMISLIWHKWRSLVGADLDQKNRGMDDDEVYGFTPEETRALIEGAGFEITKHEKIFYHLNNLYVAKKI